MEQRQRKSIDKKNHATEKFQRTKYKRLSKCDGKVSHSSWEVADAARSSQLIRAAEKGNPIVSQLNIYACDKCGEWHVGTDKRHIHWDLVNDPEGALKKRQAESKEVIDENKVRRALASIKRILTGILEPAKSASQQLKSRLEHTKQQHLINLKRFTAELMANKDDSQAESLQKKIQKASVKIEKINAEQSKLSNTTDELKPSEKLISRIKQFLQGNTALLTELCKTIDFPHHDKELSGINLDSPSVQKIMRNTIFQELAIAEFAKHKSDVAMLEKKLDNEKEIFILLKTGEKIPYTDIVGYKIK